MKESGNFHWHIVISELHSETDSANNSIFTNHFGLVNDKKNKKEIINEDSKEPVTLTHLYTSGVNLNLYCEASATFNV